MLPGRLRGGIGNISCIGSKLFLLWWDVSGMIGGTVMRLARTVDAGGWWVGEVEGWRWKSFIWLSRLPFAFFEVESGERRSYVWLSRL